MEIELLDKGKEFIPFPTVVGECVYVGENSCFETFFNFGLLCFVPSKLHSFYVPMSIAHKLWPFEGSQIPPMLSPFPFLKHARL